MSNTDLVITLLDAAAALTRRLDRSLSAIKGITFSEYQLLSALRDHASASATRVDLAAAVGLTPSGVTRALKPLEKLGFIETARDARDARKSLARLTSAGQELIGDADGVVHDTVDGLEVLHSLDEADRNQLSALMQGLSDG